jgi:pimeloyl-ACP methyl ester carboxylesterase
MPTVVLLHGLLRTARSMAGLGRSLAARGYPVWARSYPSQRDTIEDNARAIVEQLSGELPGEPLVLVTHSLGGILARFIAGPLGEQAGLDVQRILMLAPPNRGSRLARRFGHLGLFKRTHGPAGQELGAEDPAWPLPRAPVAVIAGTRPVGMNPIGWMSSVSGLIQEHEPSDGTVLVEETRLPGMVDFATVAASHTFIMNNPEVREMIYRFVGEGRLRD